MLSALVAVLLAQWTQVPEHPPSVREGQAVAVLVASDSTWEARFQALEALKQHRFTKDEVASLSQALASASTDPSGPCTHPAEPCITEIGPCLSPAGFILLAVRDSNTRDAFVQAALGVLDDPDDAFSLPVACDILAAAGHPRGESEALSLLSRGTYCLGAATRMLRALPKLTDQARPAFVEYFRTKQRGGAIVLAVLAGRPEPWAQDMASKALHHRDVASRLMTLDALDDLAELPAQVRPVLLQLAQCDPAASVRSAATEVLAKRKVRVPTGSCPAPVWTVASGVVTGPGGCVTLTYSSTASPCADDVVRRVDRDEQKPLGALVGKDCIVALNQGEFGGGLYLRRPGAAKEEIVRDSLLSPVALLLTENREEALVISSLAHMSGFGGVGRLRALPDGHYRYEPWMRFSGAQPTAWAYQDGRLFMSFDAGGVLSACPNSTLDTTLVFEADGTYSLARGPATKCLWP